MKVQPPTLKLKQPCPICVQGRTLVLLCCPNCTKLIAACDEEGSVFPDPTDLSVQAPWTCDPWVSTETQCPGCDEVGFCPINIKCWLIMSNGTMIV